MNLSIINFYLTDYTDSALPRHYEIFKYLKTDMTVLERQPLERISKIKKLGAYKNLRNWQCMDTIRDKEILENLVRGKKL